MKPSEKEKNRIQWTVRPATVEDRDKVNDLLHASYSSLLPKDYDEEFITKALPDLSKARESLLTCRNVVVVVFKSL